ncbi:unnamed protein product [Schistosoma curassoni]|uniref:Uncharacterized protein n=1 Tax=Schistosoma curassoni TaxID=6186 RepID=A0A183K100_9TREM|nr:unnamed protein product [Schistosoma curassoni]
MLNFSLIINSILFPLSYSFKTCSLFFLTTCLHQLTRL